jgi:signal transduction histidine kinase/CheY-like chemotaxis protein
MEEDFSYDNKEIDDLLTSSKNSYIDDSSLEYREEKSAYELNIHKSMFERGESICRMGYWEYDVKKDKIWASRGARVIYGFDDYEISLNDIKGIVFPEYRQLLDQMLENLIKHNDKYDVEFKIYRHNDGEIIDIRSQAEYDIQENKIFGIIQDISLQRKTEQELVKAKDKAGESDRLKSAFVSNMSHEIRTPMNGIVGFAHLLTETDLNNDTRKEYKEHIHLCCNQLIDKVNDILDIAKIESGEVVVNSCEINLNRFLNDILEGCIPQARKKNLELRLNSPNSFPEQILITDSSKLNKIIINLIDNAVRFTHSGYVEFGFRIIDAYIEFYVKDSGIGISPSHHEIIFQPFSHADSQISLDYGGTGIGLTIAKTYVTMLGGRIWLESQLSEGTTFFFTLPNTINLKETKKTLVRKKFSQPKISLVVEDMEMNYKYLQALLEPMGFSVLWAKDGNEAVEMALENEDIDLVLMDIRLPYTDGYEATKIIKKKRPDLPIIAQTANALLDERKIALKSGCNDYITKPIYKDEFKKTLSIFFDT